MATGFFNLSKPGVLFCFLFFFILAFRNFGVKSLFFAIYFESKKNPKISKISEFFSHHKKKDAGSLKKFFKKLVSKLLPN
jgi:hypothetical protein